MIKVKGILKLAKNVLLHTQQSTKPKAMPRPPWEVAPHNALIEPPWEVAIGRKEKTGSKNSEIWNIKNFLFVNFVVTKVTTAYVDARLL